MAADIGWRAAECYTLWNRGACLGPQGEYERALQVTREAIALAEETEHREWLSAALFILGAIHYDLLDVAESQTSLERALAIAMESGSMLWTRTAAGFLARCYVQQGELTLASETLDNALPPEAPAQTLGERVVHTARVALAIAQGQLDEALRILDRLEPDANAVQGAVIPRLALLRAKALTLCGDYAAAEGLYVEAASQVRKQGAHGSLWLIEAELSTLYVKLGEKEKARHAHLRATQAIDYLGERIPEGRTRDSFRAAALERLPLLRAPSPRQAAKEAFGGLTERESQVAGLIATGKSNAAIAEALVISERTVETHVTNILAKLDFSARSQIAAWAVERGVSRPSE
jgi:non-specific serine/threonine protein kinase